MKAPEGYREVFCRYITKNGKRIYPKNAQFFHKLWEEDELKFGGRSPEELEFYAEHGFWHDQKGRLHNSMQDGKLCVEWRNAPEEEGIADCSRVIALRMTSSLLAPY